MTEDFFSHGRGSSSFILLLTVKKVALVRRFRRTKVTGRLITRSADNDSCRGFRKRPFSMILARSTLFIAARKRSPASSSVAPPCPSGAKRSEKENKRKRRGKKSIGQKRSERGRQKNASQGNDYAVQQVQLGPGVAALPFTCVCTYTVDG